MFLRPRAILKICSTLRSALAQHCLSANFLLPSGPALGGTLFCGVPGPLRCLRRHLKSFRLAVNRVFSPDIDRRSRTNGVVSSKAISPCIAYLQGLPRGPASSHGVTEILKVQLLVSTKPTSMTKWIGTDVIYTYLQIPSAVGPSSSCKFERPSISTLKNVLIVYPRHEALCHSPRSPFPRPCSVQWSS